MPGTGLVLAGRSTGSNGTFPAIQRYAEGVIDRLTGDFTGVPGDYSYGPFLMRSDLVPHISAADAELGWGWRHVMFAIAHRLGLGISHVVDDFPCPPDQRGEDDAERLHRVKQLDQNRGGWSPEPPRTCRRREPAGSDDPDGPAPDQKDPKDQSYGFSHLALSDDRTIASMQAMLATASSRGGSCGRSSRTARENSSAWTVN